MTLQYWFMFPVATLIATVAMSSGVGGGVFFAPIMILALKLPPQVAIGAGLITQAFGLTSGLYAYARQRLIDFKLGTQLLVVTLPMALLGTWLTGRTEPEILKVILGVVLFTVAAGYLRAPDRKDIRRIEFAIAEEYGGEQAETCQLTTDGEQICYTVCNRTEGRVIAGVGALFEGMISSGLGELEGYFLLQRCWVPFRVAVATNVFVLALTSLLAAIGHVIRFVYTGGDAFQDVLSLVVFTVPGVILGGQLGSFVTRRIPQRTLELGLSGLLILVAILTTGEVIF